MKNEIISAALALLAQGLEEAREELKAQYIAENTEGGCPKCNGDAIEEAA